VVLMVLVLVAAGSVPADAADQAAVILELELSGASCAQTSVVVSGSSCDGQTVADALVAELTAAGFTGVACGYSNDDIWECMYSVPSGCTLEDASIVLKAGRACQWSVSEGWVWFSTSTMGAFAFDVE
jgi:hypothetical protein